MQLGGGEGSYSWARSCSGGSSGGSQAFSCFPPVCGRSWLLTGGGRVGVGYGCLSMQEPAARIPRGRVTVLSLPMVSGTERDDGSGQGAPSMRQIEACAGELYRNIS